jgi:hypothetical protein
MVGKVLGNRALARMRSCGTSKECILEKYTAMMGVEPSSLLKDMG